MHSCSEKHVKNIVQCIHLDFGTTETDPVVVCAVTFATDLGFTSFFDQKNLHSMLYSSDYIIFAYDPFPLQGETYLDIVVGVDKRVETVTNPFTTTSLGISPHPRHSNHHNNA